MDGLLVVDKPAGPTSHDVVARVRKVLRERRVGHTGTLDPAATGVLPLVVGRATRLARFLSGADKAYDAVVRLGFATDTGDASGTPVTPPHHGSMPSRDAIERALDEFRGTFLQQPPAYSAKKIGGRRSYDVARAGLRSEAVEPSPGLQPVAVTCRTDITAIDGDLLTLHIECSAGFYVRALAHDLGVRLQVGAHLSVLRRTRSGEYALTDAIPLDEAERDPAAAVSRVIPPGRMLPSMPAVVLSAAGAKRAVRGLNIGGADLEFLPPAEPQGLTPFRRLLTAAGDLVAIAEPAAAGLLHPFVVLG